MNSKLEKDGYIYDEYETYIEITGYTGDDTEIVIPSEFDGKAVTSIGKEAFLNCVNLSEIVIPENCIDVGAYVFKNCTNLEKVKISDNFSQSEKELIFEGTPWIEDIVYANQ